jgi:hypothetical protein
MELLFAEFFAAVGCAGEVTCTKEESLHQSPLQFPQFCELAWHHELPILASASLHQNAPLANGGQPHAWM